MSDPSTPEVLPSDHCIFHPVRQLLKGITLGAWLKSKPPSSVITLQASATAGQALRTLAAADISSCPCFDGRDYLGFLDISDILKALLNTVNLRDLTEENREYRLRNAGRRGAAEVAAAVQQGSKGACSLVVTVILNIATDCHHIPTQGCSWSISSCAA